MDSLCAGACLIYAQQRAAKVKQLQNTAKRLAGCVEEPAVRDLGRQMGLAWGGQTSATEIWCKRHVLGVNSGLRNLVCVLELNGGCNPGLTTPNFHHFSCTIQNGMLDEREYYYVATVGK